MNFWCSHVMCICTFSTSFRMHFIIIISIVYFFLFVFNVVNFIHFDGIQLSIQYVSEQDFVLFFFFFLVSSEIKNIWADFSTEFHKKTMKNKILLRNLFVFIIVVYLIHFPLKSINWLTNMCYWNSESSKYKKRKPKKSTKKM